MTFRQNKLERLSLASIFDLEAINPSFCKIDYFFDCTETV
jgi:hypothetical protein